MTVSAVSRLIPRPPARVDNRKAKSGDPGELKCAMAFFLLSESTVPGLVVSKVAQWGQIRTIQTLMSVVSERHVVTQDIKHADHLTEDQDTMAIRL
jgi:hypothetical protein